MVNTYTLQEDFPPLYSAMRESLRGSWNWKSCGAVLGLCSGLVAPILAAIFTVISWFSDPVWHGFALHTAATSLFAVALPLLIFGAHCLDLLDKDKKLAQVSQRASATAGDKGSKDDLERN
jgi:hypothetical protein